MIRKLQCLGNTQMRIGNSRNRRKVNADILNAAALFGTGVVVCEIVISKTRGLIVRVVKLNKALIMVIGIKNQSVVRKNYAFCPA